MRYTKDEFILIAGRLADMIEDIDETVDYVNEKFNTYGAIEIFGQGELIEFTVHMLQDIMDDTDDWIDWWFFENDCGKKGLQVYDEWKDTDSEPINPRKVDTVEELYDEMAKAYGYPKED